MPTEILMPALSPTMEEGTLAKWLISEGDTVSAGDLIAEIETDKATIEFEAVDEGTIGKILVAAGTEGVKVNSPIAVLLEDGESADDIASSPVPAEAPKPAATATSAPAPTPSAPAPNTGDRVFATPLARRIAADKGIDLSTITGSGPYGRIIRADVDGATASPKPAAAMAPAPTPSASAPSAEGVLTAYADRELREVPLDGMRKTIAARLTEAKQSIPHFYLRRDINLDALLKLRKEINQGLAESGAKLSINDFIIKASALALQAVPSANAIWAGDKIVELVPSDVAVAVAVEGGLFTPVLKDAHQKSLTTLSDEIKDLAGRARERKLAPHEYLGGSFAISNLGMFGIENFDAVINPPHGSILAVGAGIKKPVVDADGAISTATVMSVTLSCDHRVIDGALGAELLSAIKGYIEKPMTMLV